jgi:L-fuculose-phosphate aldolase
MSDHDDTAQTKQMLVDAILMLERAQVIDFNGHFSALTVDDIVMIDLDGKLLEGTAVPPMEFHIHASIYRRRPDVKSVVHTHPIWSTLFSMVGKTVDPVIMQAAVLGQIQQFPKTASINTRELGDELAECLGRHRVAMLRSHGSVIAAEGVIETFVLGFYLEETAHRQYHASQLGTPTVLTPEQVEKINGNLWKPHLLKKVWDYHQGKLHRGD